MPDTLPKFALSIRQPWAWAIINMGKDIENRDWKTKFRGPVCIHASLYKDPRGEEWDGCMSILDHIHRTSTMREMASREGRKSSARYSAEAKRGGIIGVAEIVDCVEASASPWFFGSYGFVLRNARPVDFIPVKGALGFFDWRKQLEKTNA